MLRVNKRHMTGLYRLLIGVLVLVIGIVVVVAALGTDIRAGILSFLPYLLILACPLMMLFMMGSMGHNHMSGPDARQSGAFDTVSDLKELPREEQVRALRGELTRLAWRQEALRHDLERLEAQQKAEHMVNAEQHAEHVLGNR